jgi:hypothetical protein
MPRFWTRTRTFLAAVWTAAVVAELVLIAAVQQVDNSWVLLLFAVIVALPIVAMDSTFAWLRRPPRKRWDRHDVAAEAAASGRWVVEAPVDPDSRVPPA